MRKKSEIPELNQAILSFVELRQSCWSIFNVVVRNYQLTNLSLRTVSVAENIANQDKDLGCKKF